MNLFDELTPDLDVDPPTSSHDTVPRDEPARDPRQLELPWSLGSSDG